MGADIDFRNPAVMGELKYWGEWLLDTLPIDGFRLDAVKHIPAWFFKQWIQHVQNKANNDLLQSTGLRILKNYNNIWNG